MAESTIGQVCWQLQGVSYIASKRHELRSTNGFKLDRHLTHPM